MRLPMLLIVLLLAPMLLAGCTDGGSDGDEGTDPTNQQTGGDNNTTEEPDPVTVDVGLTGIYPATIAYDPASITVPANSTVTIEFTNNDQNPIANHDWVLEGVDGAATDVIANGETTNVTFEAPAVGTYAFYCSVTGHRENGMEGTFTVE